ncbi:uncharacterized protein LOC143912202 [Arctopsyche grandis]|uniref:uncharacterized protein LOC143912202 n=1 Tax=Arctopsyche grandis TaxID=121162 RepID=UPI00406D88B8
MQNNPVLIEEKSKKLYKWAGFVIILTIVVLMCVSLPLIIIHESPKILLYALLAILIAILVVIITLTEFFRRKSNIRRRNLDDNWTSQTISLRRKRSVSDESKRLTERSSWVSWFPRKTSPDAVPTAPPIETEIY